jgi:hypothetical protein
MGRRWSGPRKLERAQQEPTACTRRGSHENLAGKPPRVACSSRTPGAGSRRTRTFARHWRRRRNSSPSASRASDTSDVSRWADVSEPTRCGRLRYQSPSSSDQWPSSPCDRKSSETCRGSEIVRPPSETFLRSANARNVSRKQDRPAVAVRSVMLPALTPRFATFARGFLRTHSRPLRRCSLLTNLCCGT